MTNQQAKITFLPSGITQAVSFGITIMEGARLARVLIESPCNCAGTCGKCRVKLSPQSADNVKERDHKHLTMEERQSGVVLACLTEVYGDISVILEQETVQPIQILDSGKQRVVDLLPVLAKSYHSETNQTDLFYQGKKIGHELGDTCSKLYGVVVDIGTTTLVVSLINLLTGQEEAAVSALNPQSVHAQDVLSRIKFASTQEGLETLHHDLVETLNQLISQVVAKAQLEEQYIYEVVYSGNTCMLHLAVNLSPQSLGKYPYTPLTMGDELYSAESCGLKISPFGKVYLPPVLSAYVGADITAGLLAADLSELKGVTLFIDIGTNGEMVLARNGQLAATSTAAGPAFEGMNISCGMRAAPGAIERFFIEENGLVKVGTIGNEPAIGLCGSGLLDVVGELVAQGLVKANGRFTTADDKLPLSLAERFEKRDGKTAFTVEGEVYLLQKDLRQIQLAKGAIRAGIELLLRSQELAASEVDRVYVAGSFGYHLRAESLIHIGLLPSEFAGKISFVGNTAKTGGQALLLNQPLRTALAQLVKKIQLIELSYYKDFEQVFVKSLSF